MALLETSAIEIICQACGTHVVIPRTGVGRQAKCSKCSAILEIAELAEPPPSETVHEPAPALVPWIPADDPDEYKLRGGAEPAAGVEPPVVPVQPSSPISSPAGEHQVVAITQPQYFPVVCPSCQTRIYVSRHQTGQSIICRTCRQAMTVTPPPATVLKQPDDPDDVRLAPPLPRAVTAEPLLKSPAEDAAPRKPTRQEPKLPPWPLVTGVFTFPFTAGIWERWCGLAIWLGVFLLLIRLDVGFIESGGLGQSLGAIMFSLIAAVVGGFWLIAAAGTLVTVLDDSSEGLDRMTNWPDSFLFGGFRELLCVVNAFTIGVLPGSAIAWALRRLVELNWLFVPISLLILFPFILLSMREVGSPMALFSRPIWESLKGARSAWRMFYLESALIYVATGGLAWAAWCGVADLWGLGLAAAAITAGLLIYFRLLGRLAWICAVRPPDYEEVLDEDELYDEAGEEFAHQGSSPVPPSV